MNISQILLMLEKEIKEANLSDQEKSEQENLSSKIKNKKLIAPKSKKDKDKLKDKKKDEDALDSFDKEFERKKSKSTSSDDDYDELEDDYDDLDAIEQDIEDEEAKKKEFKLEDAKSFSSFMDLVNNFRASSSLRDNPKVKEYFSKLKEGEKQAICIFFSNLEKVANFEGDVDFKMPKSPTMMGLTINSAVTQEEKKEKSTIQKAASGNKKADKELNSITPIKVGTNENKQFTIDMLLKEIK
jgi:hypothetical protein